MRTAGASFVRWVPLLLLLAAAVLYARDVRESRHRAQAANLIRHQTTLTVTGVALGWLPEGRTIPFLFPLPMNLATNLLRQFSETLPSKFPRGVVEGEEFELHLMNTNTAVSVLSAAILESDPSSLYVRMRVRQEGSDPGTPGAWTFSRPARVPEAGEALGILFRELQDASGTFPPEVEMMQGITNTAHREVSPQEEAPLVPSEPGPASEPEGSAQDAGEPEEPASPSE